MDKEKVKSGILSAINLINNELDTIEYDSLKEEYLETLDKLNIALDELNEEEEDGG